MRLATRLAKKIMTNDEAWLGNRLVALGVSGVRAGLILSQIKAHDAYQGRLFILAASPERPDVAKVLDSLRLNTENVFDAGTGEWADSLGCFLPVVRLRNSKGTLVCGLMLGVGESYGFGW